MSDISAPVARKISGLPLLTGAAFRVWRCGAGLTQVEAAALLGLSAETISNYERADGPLSTVLTLAVAHLNTLLPRPVQKRGAA